MAVTPSHALSTSRPIWARSVDVDADGVGWVNGTRTDFVLVLFMHGYSLADLSDGLVDGYTNTEPLEDALRFEFSRRVKRKAPPKRSGA